MTTVTNITTRLTEKFETQALGSLRNGQPPFGELIKSLSTHSPDVQSAVVKRIAGIWAGASDKCQAIAALQFSTMLHDRPWMPVEQTAGLMKVARALAANNTRMGQDWAVRGMREATVRNYPVLTAMIDAGVKDAAGWVATPARTRPEKIQALQVA